jgi:alkylhydroperoxidase/carboxymuconolactone decarboxylase family protein YurZ
MSGQNKAVNNLVAEGPTVVAETVPVVADTVPVVAGHFTVVEETGSDRKTNLL